MALLSPSVVAVNGHVVMIGRCVGLLSVSVYYVAVRTIVLSRHGSNLARPVIIHDIIHGLIYVPGTPCCGFFGVSPDGKVLLRLTQSQSDEPSDLSGSLSPTSVYSTWQSQAVTHPIMN